MALGRLRAGSRDALFRTVSVIPAVHDYLARMRFITQPDYGNGVAVTPARQVDRRLAAGVGLALGQPRVSTPDGAESMLDDHLGDGWVLLALGDGAEAATLRAEPYWSGLEARRVRVTRGGASTNHAGFAATLIDRDGMLALAHLTTPHWVVVRPDRYVAAVFTAETELAVVEGLKPFVDPELKE